MRNLDFSSWHALLSTLVGLAAITLGPRLLVMQSLQQRRERRNRQINESGLRVRGRVSRAFPARARRAAS